MCAAQAKAGIAPGPTAMGVPIAQIYGHQGRPEAGGPAQHNSKYATPEDQSEGASNLQLPVCLELACMLHIIATDLIDFHA